LIMCIESKHKILVIAIDKNKIAKSV
jgi:hypothetical protein